MTRLILSGWTKSRMPTTTKEEFLAVEGESSGSEGYTTDHASPSQSTCRGSLEALPHGGWWVQHWSLWQGLWKVKAVTGV